MKTKVSFLYNSQLHQIPHTLPIALELAAHHPDIQVDVAAVSKRHIDFAKRLAQHYGLDTPVRFVELPRPWFVRAKAWLTGELAPNKRRTLLANLPYLLDCDAVVTPERTSLFLRKEGRLPGTRMLFTDHGAGDRAVAVSADICEFDFVLNAGSKIERRRLALGLIRPGDYVSGVYAKFDWLYRKGTGAKPMFDNGRPTVLYSPHFEPGLSSWPKAGFGVLDYFAASSRYNLIFAPHVRLFEPPRPSKYRAFRAYADLPHMKIDLGSEHSIDMSYTLAADAWLGDVSSQVAEFLVHPRPCLFLNTHHVRWQNNPDYRFWTLGPVIDDVDQLEAALQAAFNSHATYLHLQRDYFESTFDGIGLAPSARRGADAIADYLHRARPG